MESNQAGHCGREGYSLAGVRPVSLTLRIGTRCRLSACDIRFVGPTLFASELTGHRLATTSGNDPLSPSRRLGCDTCRISGLKLAADLRLERSASGLTVRFPHPVGLSAKKRFGAECGNRTRLICLEGFRPKATRPTPLTSRALCFALRLPVSMRRIVACAGLWAGVFGWSESGGSLALVTCLPPALRRRQGQSELDPGDSGFELPE